MRAADQPGFHAIQEELLLKTLRIVEEAGTALAFPSQTVYVRGEDRDAGSASTLRGGGTP